MKGKNIQQLQSSLRKYLQVDNIELIVNGHLALELSLNVLDLQGDVITTPFTFASTTHAIVRNGLKPVFVILIRTFLLLTWKRLKKK